MFPAIVTPVPTSTSIGSITQTSSGTIKKNKSKGDQDKQIKGIISKLLNVTDLTHFLMS